MGEERCLDDDDDLDDNVSIPRFKDGIARGPNRENEYERRVICLRNINRASPP